MSLYVVVMPADISAAFVAGPTFGMLARSSSHALFKKRASSSSCKERRWVGKNGEQLGAGVRAVECGFWGRKVHARGGKRTVSALVASMRNLLAILLLKQARLKACVCVFVKNVTAAGRGTGRPRERFL